MAFSPSSPPVHVFKFGGTSVGTPERIQNVVRLVLDEPADARRVVVVSALGGVTDRLLQAIDEALQRTEQHRAILEELRKRHAAAVQALVGPEEQEALLVHLAARWRELGELLDGVYLLRECTRRTRDAVIGMGERVSAPIVAAAFRTAGASAVAIEATDLIRTDDSFGEASVHFEVTNAQTQARFADLPPEQIAVVTGFIASTERGVLTTLGRSGSDYTATILAGALQAARVVIWTDVDGVLSADPRLVPEAFPLAQLTYREAAELAYFGAKVLHPRTIRPLLENDIPLQIKNTMNPTAPGTRITLDSGITDGHVKAVTSIRRLAIVILEGTGMIGVPGISARAFGALAAQRINVLLISQASSEQNICIVVREEEGEPSVRALEEAFQHELERGIVGRVTALTDCAIISVVGENIRERPGLAGRMFSTLGRSGVNVLAIAQGASQANISAVVRDPEVHQGLRALHEAFALGRDRAHLFLIGPGVIGRALLRMLAEQAPVLLEQLNLNLQLVGLANQEHMVWDVGGLPFGDALHRLQQARQPMDLDAVIQHLVESRLERLIVVDATASDEVSQRYATLLESKIAVITPNKRGNAGTQAYYERLQRAAQRNQVPYLYETTVGAGLPLLSTMRDLQRSGDRVQRVEAVLSGTLAYVFDSLAQDRPFSEIVRTARDEGYTEPDPRDDLSGEDVARKLLILAREMGLRVERTDVEVESLVPDHLQDIPLEAFLERLPELDDGWRDRCQAAQASGERLQYLAGIEAGRLRVRVQPVATDSPFAALRGTDNMVVYTTERYQANPLVIRGPGAGPDVTAAGILADVIRAAQLVG